MQRRGLNYDTRSLRIKKSDQFTQRPTCESVLTGSKSSPQCQRHQITVLKMTCYWISLVAITKKTFFRQLLLQLQFMYICFILFFHLFVIFLHHLQVQNNKIQWSLRKVCLTRPTPEFASIINHEKHSKLNVFQFSEQGHHLSFSKLF